MLSPSLEDYLEEIYQLSLQKKEIRVRDIAEKIKRIFAIGDKSFEKVEQG